MTAVPNDRRPGRPVRPRRVARRLAVLGTAVVLAALAVTPSAAAQEEDDGDPLLGVREVVVKLDPAAGATIDAVNADYGTRTLDTLLGSAVIHLLGLPDGAEPQSLSETLEEDPRLLYAEPNYTQQAPEGLSRFNGAWSDGRPGPAAAAAYTGQYAVAQLGLPQAHATTRGSGVTIAVLDTGFQLDHPVLAGRVAPGGYDFVDDDTDPGEGRNGLDDDGDGDVDEGVGHGTHVAGAALLVAPEATVLPIRVLDSDGAGSVFTSAEAVGRAIAAGADVITMSFGSTAASQLLGEVEGDAGRSGAVLVAAAGNLGSTQRQYPAADEGTIAVTATDAGGARAPFANHGSWVRLAAPGDDIVSALPVGTYAEWDGTSMATPLVAGGAALLLAVRPMDGGAVESVLRSTAVPVTGGGGIRRVDLAAAVGAIGSGGDEDEEVEGD